MKSTLNGIASFCVGFGVTQVWTGDIRIAVTLIGAAVVASLFRQFFIK